MIFHGDAIDWLSTFDAGTIDLVVTDPPYESLEKHRKIGTTTRLSHSAGSSNDWFTIFPNERFPELFRQLYRVLKKDAHCYLFSDVETMFVVKPMAEAAGFKFWKPIIWDKVAIGMGYHYRARYECILFFEKGKRKLNDLGIADVITCKRIHAGYPTEKPVAVSKVLIEQSSEPGKTVIDPFCGSGSVGVAAKSAGRLFQGCDISIAAVDIANKRIRDAKFFTPLGHIYGQQEMPDDEHHPENAVGQQEPPNDNAGPSQQVPPYKRIMLVKGSKHSVAATRPDGEHCHDLCSFYMPNDHGPWCNIKPAEQLVDGKRRSLCKELEKP